MVPKTYLTDKKRATVNGKIVTVTIADGVKSMKMQDITSVRFLEHMQMELSHVIAQ